MGYRVLFPLLVAGMVCCLVSLRTEAACNVTMGVNVKCTSWSYKRSACRVPGSVTAISLKKQISKTPCRKNINYGYQDNNVWVDYGCRGVFTVKYCKLNVSSSSTVVTELQTTPVTNKPLDQSQTTNTVNQDNCTLLENTDNVCLKTNTTSLKCKSKSYKWNDCRVPGTVMDICLKKQISKTPCRKNINYGYQDNDVWVDYGCRGVFTVRYCTVNISSSAIIDASQVTKNTSLNQSQTTNTTNPGHDTDNGLVLALSTVIPLVAILTASAVALYKLRKHPNTRACSRKVKSLIRTKKSTREPSGTLAFSPVLHAILSPDTQIKLKPLIHDRKQLEIQEIIYKGAFGSVFKGALHHQEDGTQHTKSVAIKTIADNSIGSDITAFVNEAITMAELQHPHVLSIIGVCIDSNTDVPMIILPYMANGDLRTYLRTLRRGHKDTEARDPDEKQLLLFCLHISCGMEYLSAQKIVHRDLATRNCMVDSDLQVKVADFGLARDVYSDSYYRQVQHKLLPVRWMPIECLEDHVFTLQSDIWSFGVTMWEVFSMGRVPYMHLDNGQIAAHLQAGNRLEQPELCPTEMYNLMRCCFEDAPEKRPNFTEISRRISDSLATLCGYVDLTPEASQVDNNDDYTIEYLDHISVSIDIPDDADVDDDDNAGGYEDAPIPYGCLESVHYGATIAGNNGSDV